MARYHRFMTLALNHEDYQSTHQARTAGFDTLEKYLEDIFLDAARCKNDAAAKRFYLELRAAILERILKDFLEEGGDHVPQRTAQVLLPVQRSFATLDWQYARMAMRLWPKLPVATTQTPAGGIFPTEAVESVPVLLDTKRLLLEDIAWCWKISPNGSKPDEVFAFLNNVVSPFPKEREVFEKVIRDTTKEMFSIDKVTEGITTILKDTSVLNTPFLVILLQVWARFMAQYSQDQLKRYFEIGQAARLMPPRTYQFLLQEAQQLASMEKPLRTLQADLTEEGWFGAQSCEVSIISTRTIGVSVDDWKEVEGAEEEVQRLLDRSSEVVRVWRAYNNSYEVQITCTLYDGPAKEKQLAHRRKLL